MHSLQSRLTTAQLELQKPIDEGYQRLVGMGSTGQGWGAAMATMKSINRGDDAAQYGGDGGDGGYGGDENIGPLSAAEIRAKHGREQFPTAEPIEAKVSMCARA
jgi:hypothetical protein